MAASRVVACGTFERVCEAAIEIGERGSVDLIPVGQHAREQPAASKRDRAHDLSSLPGQSRRPLAPIRLRTAPHDVGQAFKFCDLPADRRVVATHCVGQFRDTQRAARIKRHQQRKQGAVEADARLAEEGVSALRTVQEPDQIHQRAAQSFHIACILHLYAASKNHHIACMLQAYRILVIVGSTRARRLCPQIAEWVAKVGRQSIPAEFEVVDLKDWPLPMDDEFGIPALDDYAFEHTRAWSRKVSEADAFVFVAPQYNWGYPAPLKNALDHLYNEWAGKPAMIVTYGGHRGDKCARQLRQVLKGLKMRPIGAMPGFKLMHDRIKANTGEIDPATEFSAERKALAGAFAGLMASLRGKRLPAWLWPW